MAAKLKGTRNIMLVGKSGSGKSSSGNTIFQEDVFDVPFGYDPATTRCRLQNGTILGWELNVMDSPGWFSEDQSPEETQVSLVQAVVNMRPGCDAFLYVIRCSAKFTQEEVSAYRRFKKLFGSDVTNHMIILFTGGDDLKPGTNFKEALKKAPKMLKDVLDDCNWRFVIFNNKSLDNLEQVQQLLDLIDQICHGKGDQPYIFSSYSDKTGEPLEIQVQKQIQENEKQEARENKHVQVMEQMLLKQKEEMNLLLERHKKELAAIRDSLDEETRRLAVKWEIKRRQEKDERERKYHELEVSLQREREKQEEERRRHEQEMQSFNSSDYLYTALCVAGSAAKGIIDFMKK